MCDYRSIGSFSEKEDTAINFWEMGVGAERPTVSEGKVETGKRKITFRAS